MTKSNIVATLKLGKFKLLEKEIYGHDDSICFVYFNDKKIATYCSIADAMNHKCEWMR